MVDNSTSPTSPEPPGGFWSDGTWRSLNVATAPVRPFKQSGIDKDGANYLLAVGEEVYLSTQSAGKKVQKLAENEDFSIEPGQFAFILTDEEVRIPFDKIGFISIRASVKFLGLVNISGFHIDPGYKGKLIFAVFNAGPTRIHLRRGERVFPLWIANLDTKMQRTEWKTGYDKIPSNLITSISGEFTTAYQLAEQLKTAKADITELKNFRLYATTIATVVLLVLSPYIKTTLEKIFTPPSTQSSTAVTGAGNP